MKSKIIFTLIGLLSLISSFAQNPQWMYFARYENITALAEDSFNIWVGTTTGLIKIDKATEQQTVYNKVNSGIPINYITKLFVDHNQNLWLTNDESKLVKYDGQTWLEFNYLDTNEYNNYKKIKSIAEDKNGNMWFGTYKLGVVKYDSQQFTLHTEYLDVTDNKLMPLTENYAIAVDSANDIWISIDKGIATCHHQGYWSDLGNMNAWNGIPVGDVTVLKNDKNGMLWAGSQANDGVVAPSLVGGEISYHDATGWHFVPDPNHYIYAVNDLTFDNAGNMYAATLGNGVLKYDGSQLSLVTHGNQVVKSLIATSVLYDSQGRLWIGTDKGLYKKTGNTIIRVKMPSSDIETNYLSGRFEKRDGTIYLQYTKDVWSEFSGTRIFKVSGGDTIEFRHPLQRIIDFQFEDSLGNVWGNVDWYYPIIKLQDTTITLIEHDTVNYPLPGQIYDITWDKTTHLFWLATQGGLFTYNPDNDVWHHEGNFMNSFYSGDILSVFADSTGWIWVGSVLSGPAKYKNNQWISQNYSWTMFNKTIVDIIEDQQQNLWFVDYYDQTIGRYNGNSWRVFNKQNAPFSYETISPLAFDKNNKLYLCQFNSGIRTFNGYHWDSAKVINSYVDTYVRKIYIDKNDNIWFSGNGITVYNPNGIVLSNQGTQSQHNLQKQIAEVYPNPATDELNVRTTGKAGVMKIVLYNMQGQAVLKREFINSNKGIITLNTGKITPGIYVLYIETGSGVQNSKVIIGR